MEPLKSIFPKIKKKAKTVYVVHERKPPANPLFYDFDWDAIVCFDERYKQQWLKKFDVKKIHIIPYPTGYLRKGDKQKSRKKLDLPLDERIIFSYGWAPELHIFPILSALQELSEQHPFTYLVLADPKYIAVDIEWLKNRKFTELRYELAPMDRIYAYLHASDIYLVHKQKEEIREGEAVVPLMCLGALTPIITSNTEFTWFLDKEVLKYSNEDELKNLIIRAFKGDKIVDETLSAAQQYTFKRSPEKISKEFIRLFEQILP